MLAVDTPIAQPAPMQPGERRSATVTGLGKPFESRYDGFWKGEMRQNVYFRLNSDLDDWEDLKVNLPVEQAQSFAKGESVVAILGNLGSGFQLYKRHAAAQLESDATQAKLAAADRAEALHAAAQSDAVRDVWSSSVDLQRCAFNASYRDAVLRQLMAVAKPAIAQRRHRQQYGWQGVESPDPVCQF